MKGGSVGKYLDLEAAVDEEMDNLDDLDEDKMGTVFYNINTLTSTYIKFQAIS